MTKSKIKRRKNYLRNVQKQK